MKDLAGKSYMDSGFFEKYKLPSEEFCIFDLKEPNPITLHPLPPQMSETTFVPPVPTQNLVMR